MNWQWMEGMEAEASGNYEAAAEAYKTSLQGEAPTKRLPLRSGTSVICCEAPLPYRILSSPLPSRLLRCGHGGQIEEAVGINLLHPGQL